MWLEEKLIYFPDRYPVGFYELAGTIQPREGGFAPAIEDCTLLARDGVRLHGWFCSPRTRKGDGEVVDVPTDRLLLWLHGNAGNVTSRLDLICMFMRLPVQVFIFDYRGYGRSEGKPTEEGVYLDARAAWSYIVQERGIDPKRIVLFGKSLGGGPACELATHVEPAGLIVQSSFSSIPDMAGVFLPLLGRLFCRTRMESVAKVPHIRCPKLFVHSPVDEIVPYRLGRRLFEAAAEPKEFYEVSGAGHNETHIVGGEPYLEKVRQFIDGCCSHTRPPG